MTNFDIIKKIDTLNDELFYFRKYVFEKSQVNKKHKIIGLIM